MKRNGSVPENLLFSRKQLIQLMGPLIIEQLLAVTVGVADTVMITGVGEAAVSGVSFVDTINALIIFVLSALANGGAVVISQYLGRNNEDRARVAAKQLLYSVFSLALVLALLCYIFRDGLLQLIYGTADPYVLEASVTYLSITAFSFPFLAINNACAAVFRSTGNSRASMRASLLMNVLNIGGNAYLIYSCNMGVSGAAIATLVSRAASGLILFIMLLRKSQRLSLSGIFHFSFDTALVKQILRIGIPSGVENGMFHLGKLFVQSLLATLTTAEIAANAICTSIANFLVIPGTAIGLGMITVVGQCIGAGRYDQVEHYVPRLMCTLYAFLILICGMLMLIEKPLLSVFGLSKDALQFAMFLFPIIIVSHVTVWPYAFPFANVLRASGDVRFTMIVSTVSMFLLRILLANIFIRYMGFGAEGIWYAMFADWILRAAVFILRYRSGKWKIKRVIDPQTK